MSVFADCRQFQVRAPSRNSTFVLRYAALSNPISPASISSAWMRRACLLCWEPEQALDSRISGHGCAPESKVTRIDIVAFAGRRRIQRSWSPAIVRQDQPQLRKARWSSSSPSVIVCTLFDDEECIACRFIIFLGRFSRRKRSFIQTQSHKRAESISRVSCPYFSLPRRWKFTSSRRKRSAEASPPRHDSLLTL